MSGQLQNPTGLLLDDDAIQYYGTEGAADNGENFFEESRPIFEGPPSVSGGCLQMLSDEITNTQASQDYGIGVYQRAVQIITSHDQNLAS